jgi:hypothetical protein
MFVREYVRNADVSEEVREKRRAYERERYQRCLAITNAAKNIPCMDCGVCYPPYVMQFDHRDPATKHRHVALIRGIAALKREIEKCDVVCANCHAERTWGNK